MNEKRINELKEYIRILANSFGDFFLHNANSQKNLPGCPKKTVPEILHINTTQSNSARLEFVKFAIRYCAEKYKIDLPKILVKFSKLSGNKAGCVTNKSGSWYVEIDIAHKWDNNVIIAIVAHEMAHVVLGLKNISLTPLARNEELVDTTAIFAGFGGFLHYASQMQKGNSIHKVGYLQRDEIKYLINLKGRVSNKSTIVLRQQINVKKSRITSCYLCSTNLRVPEKTGWIIIICPLCKTRQKIKLIENDLNYEKGNSKTKIFDDKGFPSEKTQKIVKYSLVTITISVIVFLFGYTYYKDNLEKKIKDIKLKEFIEDRPISGSVRYNSNKTTIAPFKINTSEGSDYLVKLSNYTSGADIMTVFVRGGTSVEVEVPIGTYELKYASGTTWYGYDKLFGSETLYSKSDSLLNFRETSTGVSGYEVKLYKVIDGNMRTRSISASDF